MKNHRPSRYKPEFAAQARLAYELGACDAQVAELLSVSISTLYRWRHKHRDFAAAAVIGKEPSDNRVELALYERAIGFDYQAERVFMPAHAEAPVVGHYTKRVLAHPGAALQWLAIRRPDRWRLDSVREDNADLADRLEQALRRVADGRARDAEE